ncbi:MAG: hypothetical protein A2Z83_04315 [Omnitrophica bacterium GWA2_52_8]|nr:MAG: hypothetical protein A2Z83_04315 [Omnitrophica bacterium GWA2_52_8]
MPFKFAKQGAPYKGMMAGLGLAGLSFLLFYMSGGDKEPFYTFGSFLAAAPILLLLPHDLPDFLSCAVILVYWASVGAGIGWLLGWSKRFKYIAALVCALGVGLAHGITLNIIMNRIGDALAAGISRMVQTMAAG